MLNKTLEFLRMADPQPTDEKVRKRRESAQDLLTFLREDHSILLDFLQGIVAGFGTSPFTQESPAVVQLIKIIKDRDATLPHDLKENALELRAVAGITVGELLTDQTHGGPPTNEGILAALSIRSALSLRPLATEKYIKWTLNALIIASDEILQSAAILRRKRGTPALQRLAEMTEFSPDTDLWKIVVPTVTTALQEATAQAAIDREEIETLWWMFAAHSELAQKPLADLTPVDAALCVGIEFAERMLLPPSLGAPAMIKRSIEAERKASTLIPFSLLEMAKGWSQTIIDALCPIDGSRDESVLRYPALLPVSWACRRLRECNDGSQKLGKEIAAATGVSSTHPHSSAEWGEQVFWERILQRFLLNTAVEG
jgi:hypothetical protein